MAGVLSAGATAFPSTPGNTRPAATDPGGAPTPITPVSLSSFMPTNPGAATATAAAATQSNVGTAPTAAVGTAAPMASITNGMINPNDSTNAASQVDAITAANSPYIQQAQQQGYLSAAARGLGNSSLASGASEAAAVQAAAPLAEENAQLAGSANLQNSQLTTQANEFNASQENANQQLEAQLATQTSQFNASNQTQVGETNAQAVNAINAQTQSLTAQLNQQFVSGSQAQTLASIQGKWNSFIQANSSAAALMQTTMSSIGAEMNNSQLAPQHVAEAITAQLELLNNAFTVMNAVEGGGGAPTTAINPGNVAGAGSGSFFPSQFPTQSTPGAPGAKTLPTVPRASGPAVPTTVKP